ARLHGANLADLADLAVIRDSRDPHQLAYFESRFQLVCEVVPSRTVLESNLVEDSTRIAVRRREANLADPAAVMRESLSPHQLAYFESRFRHRRFRIAQVCARTIVQVLAAPQNEGEQKQNVAADVGQV